MESAGRATHKLLGRDGGGVPLSSASPPAQVADIQQVAISTFHQQIQTTQLTIQAEAKPAEETVCLYEEAEIVQIHAMETAEWTFMKFSRMVDAMACPALQSLAPSTVVASPPPPLPLAAPAAPQQVKPVDDEYRLRQKKLLTLFGTHFFKHYLKFLIPAFTSKCLKRFCKPIPSNEIAALLAKSLLPPPQDPSAAVPKKQPVVFKSVKSLNTLLEIELRALSEWMQVTINGEREDFADLMMDTVIPLITQTPLDEKQAKLAHAIFKLYVPDVLHATLHSCSSLLRGMDKEARTVKLGQLAACLQAPSSQPVEQLTSLFCSIINQMPQPLEAALHSLFVRLSDEAAVREVMKSLQEPLLALFFPQPGSLSPTVKNICVSTLKMVHDYFHTLNAAKENSETIKLGPQEKERMAANALLQNLCTKYKIICDDKIPEQKRYGNALKKALERLVWLLLHPETKSEPGKRTPVQQRSVLIATTCGHTLIKQALKPYTLNCLIKRLLKQNITISSAFERPAASKKAAAQDPEFNRELDRWIPEIISNIVKFKTENGFLRLVGQGALKVGTFFNVVPKGEEIQAALIDLAASDAFLTLPLVLIQVCYRMEPPPKPVKQQTKEQHDHQVRERVFKTLGRHRSAFDVEALIRADRDKRDLLQEKIDQKMLGSPEALEKLLTGLPIGTGPVIDLIQRVYVLIRDPAMKKLLATYILVGITQGLETSIPLPINPQPDKITPAVVK